MNKESFLGRAVSSVGKFFSGLRPSGEAKPGPFDDFTPAERRMLERASRMEIIGGKYSEAGELTASVFQARAERLKREQPQEQPQE